MKRVIRKVIRALGFDIIRYRPGGREPSLPQDLSSADREVLQRVADYTMTSVERQAALMGAVRHVIRRNIAGCMVECGVWRGGSSMAVALTLLQEDAGDRDLYLFDTFEGMTAPAEVDKTGAGVSAKTILDATAKVAGKNIWCLADLDDVRRNMAATGYPQERVHFVKGPVEKTIPDQAPSAPIALLRLDTDWYESTRHELIHLFPRLARGGILIVDDYGHWAGARKAVDEYLSGLPEVYFLHRIDDTGRLLVAQ